MAHKEPFEPYVQWNFTAEIQKEPFCFPLHCTKQSIVLTFYCI